MTSRTTQIETRLLALAAVFLALYTLALTLSPAARLGSWQVAYHWEVWLIFLAWLVAFAIAQHQARLYAPERDPYLLPIAGMLTGWGTLAIWRIQPEFGWRQTSWLLVGMGLLAFGLKRKNLLDVLRRYKYIWLTSGLVLTALTLLFGTNPMGYGPRLWLGCCGFYFQPSEPLKLLLTIYLAAYLADRQAWLLLARGTRATRANRTNRLGVLLPLLAPTLMMSGLALLLLVAQRDLGTAVIFLILYASMVYFATNDWPILLLTAVGLGVAALIGISYIDLVRQRVETWINPWLDPSASSYQIVQSLIAIAHGSVFGRGPGLGYPNLVPIAHSDFIYTTIVEESGLLGGAALLLLIGLLAQRGFRLALQAADPYRRFLAAGITVFLVSQSLLIIAGNIRLLPLTGVTLPFVSYGGSSLITGCACLLVLLQVSRPADIEPAPLPWTRPYLQVAGFLWAGLFCAALITAWWGIWHARDLTSRPDNPRPALDESYTPGGTLVDNYRKPHFENHLHLIPQAANPPGYTCMEGPGRVALTLTTDTVDPSIWFAGRPAAAIASDFQPEQHRGAFSGTLGTFKGCLNTSRCQHQLGCDEGAITSIWQVLYKAVPSFK